VTKWIHPGCLPAEALGCARRRITEVEIVLTSSAKKMLVSLQHIAYNYEAVTNIFDRSLSPPEESFSFVVCFLYYLQLGTIVCVVSKKSRLVSLVFLVLTTLVVLEYYLHLVTEHIVYGHVVTELCDDTGFLNKRMIFK